MALTLLLCGVLLATVACQELGSDTADEATTTSAPETTDISVLFGTWDGTYTPETAWSEDGPVDDPPIELGVPIAMHMELRPWSADSADFGTITTGTFSPARVVALTLEGDQVTIITSSGASGLDDLLGVSTYTLDGDTLTGEEDPETGVPSGWISTAGPAYLTRTAPYDPATATETTASVAPDPAPGGAGDGGGADAGDGAEEPPRAEQVPREIPDPVLTLAEGDHGGHGTITVGDRVTCHLDFDPADEVAQVTWSSTSEAILFRAGGSHSRDPATGIYSESGASFDAYSTGHVGIICLARYEDGTLHMMWQYFLVVE